LTSGRAPVRRAAALGAATGPRTFLAPAALALRGRLGDGRFGRAAKFALPALALGELIGDKLSFAPPRVEGPGLVGRVASGAFSGAVVAGPRGARVGAAFALAATYPSQLLRAEIVERTEIPDLACAVPEDLLAASITQHFSVDGPKTQEGLEFSSRQHRGCDGIVAIGAAVGAAATAGQWVETTFGRTVPPAARAAVFAATAAVVYEAFSA
jgi:uncharacterized membrane protein